MKWIFCYPFSILNINSIFSYPNNNFINFTNYKVSNYYSPENEQTIYFNDKDLSIDWNVNTHNVILSEKDKKGLLFNDIESPF